MGPASTGEVEHLECHSMNTAFVALITSFFRIIPLTIENSPLKLLYA